MCDSPDGVAASVWAIARTVHDHTAELKACDLLRDERAEERERERAEEGEGGGGGGGERQSG